MFLRAYNLRLLLLSKGYLVSPRSRLIKPSNLRALPSKQSSDRVSPFLKWAGGKSQLLSSYEEHFPKSIKRYFEPFTGGAAVFFQLRNKFGADFHAELSDMNQELINCYSVIRDDLESLLEDLHKHENNEDYFYAIRAVSTGDLSDVERASRLIYLNKTCFNGLYRVNSKGKFNVPFGFYKNPATRNEPLLRSCSRALQNTDIAYRPFEDILLRARKGDFVYFDPPYHPLNSTSNFTSYTKNSFSANDQIRLAETFSKLHERGCLVMLSNSDSEFVRDLYAEFHIETVYAMRAINCKASGRGKISEVLVMNY